MSPRYFDPCAATAAMFLYAQGTTIVCCHQDTLTIERRFACHADEVQLLAVDNASEIGAGRLVVSYDAGQTAIVWDLMTGHEVARFASYESLTCASWMRNGNVAFGNTQGNVILFEPSTSEHISARTIDQIPVTAIAPGADCRTFALGYQNGSLLIATLQPRFTILHNLTTSRGPSPIVTLAWHASSSRQKSDMLAVQTNDGDLRVWSVAKTHSNEDPAKVVRILKKSEDYPIGPNWMGWSKNGRIIQFSEGETISWDVRTKHVTFDAIPTLEVTRGLAVYGPGASLFTIGANKTVQQFDLNAPARMVANVQHPANLLPPSPPISIEEQEKGHSSTASHSESESILIHAPVSESEEEHMSPLARLVRSRADPEADKYHHNNRTTSPASSQSQSSVSMPSHGLTENTYMSAGTCPQQSMPVRRETDSISTTSASSLSMGSSHRSRHRPSRLRHEIPRSPDDSKVRDLFKFTKSRLMDVPFKQPCLGHQGRLTNDDLRRQMLSVIFGWHQDVEDLLRDEMARHALGSGSRILLAKWLGDIDADVMAASSHTMTSSDWMLLALSGMGGQASQHKLGRAYVQRLLENGEVHAAATIMLGMGDHNDAIEIYVSHHKFMEALLLTCLCFPTVWERQEHLIKRWGEWAVQHGQEQLAIRCFACTGNESSEPWTSPSANQLQFAHLTANTPELLSPPLSPPSVNHGPQRSIAKSSLKLITSFGDSDAKTTFFGANGGGKTPSAAGVTPIAESAISPGGFDDPTTAVLRPSHRSALNTPASARPARGFGRPRLASIGEAPDSQQRATLMIALSSSASRDRDASAETVRVRPPSADVLPRASTASPAHSKGTKSRSRKKGHVAPPSPSPHSMAVLMGGPAHRNGSRSRIPQGLDLHLPAVDDVFGADEVTSPNPSAASSARYHWPSRRRVPGSMSSSVASGASSVGRSHRGHPSVAKSLDDYIHSLEAASEQSRCTFSKDGRGRVRDSSRGREAKAAGCTSSRGYVPMAKRSPTSPVPMSPEDLISLSTPLKSHTDEAHVDEPTVLFLDTRQEKTDTRGVARDRTPDGRRPPAATPTRNIRGRSADRESPVVRSPSPLPLPPPPPPMSAAGHYYYGSEDEEDFRQALEAQERFRRQNERSASRSRNEIQSPLSAPSCGRNGKERPKDGEHERSEGRPREKSRSPRVPQQPVATPAPLQLMADHAGDLKVIKDERKLKKEAAARELEERRQSLARRPLAPPIPHPDDIVNRTLPAVSEVPGRSPSAVPGTSSVVVRDLPTRSVSTETVSQRNMYASRGAMIGLPATPKAMRLVLESDFGRVSRNPVVPAVPASHSPVISPKKTEVEVPSNLTESTESPKMLLPSTVYSPPTTGRPPIARAMSAPPEEPVPAPRGSHGRKLSMAEGLAAARRPSHDAASPPQARRPSHDNNSKVPTPSPAPAPPLLRELQHLASPPPPPPAPLPSVVGGAKPIVYGGKTSGTIEIVMDDGTVTPALSPPPPPAAAVPVPVESATVPHLVSPAPPGSRNGHRRGRSSVDTGSGGFGTRFSRATDRMRSASRSRQNKDGGGPAQSPERGAAVPYESVVLPLGLDARADKMLRSPEPMQTPQAEWRTGLLQSEMI